MNARGQCPCTLRLRQLISVALPVLLVAITHPTNAAPIQGWVQRYNQVTSNGYHYASSIVSDSAGDIIVTGISDNSDMLTIKYSGANGFVLWEKRYNGPGNSFDEPRALAVDVSRNVVITGSSYGTNGVDYYTAKYSGSDGSLLWERRYDGGSYDAPRSVATDSSGNVIVTGSSSKGAPSYDSDFYTVKYAASDGAVLWERRYDRPTNSSDVPYALGVDSSGNVIVTGSDYYTAKYAAIDGSVLWERRSNSITNSFGDQALALAIDASDNVLVTGASYNNAFWDRSDYYTAKYAASDGAVLWERRYNGPTNGTDFATAVAVDNNGNVIVTGGSERIARGWEDVSGFDYYTAKYRATDGALLWEARYNGPTDSEDLGRAVSVDAIGDVIVMGYSVNCTRCNDYDYHTLKYAGADGALLWEKRYGGPGNRHDEPRALTVDFNGNVVVTGFSSVFYSSEFYTAKYSAQGGNLLWDQHYNGPGNSADRPAAVAIDGAGNVVVTGTSTHATNYYYYTAKYAAVTGALLWERRHNGTRNGYARAAAMALDASGNVVVTGFSPTGTNLLDYYTVKYASEDGALIWERWYNGPSNGSDQATALGLDRSGNVIVTGSSYNSTDRNDDFYTAKYAAADGAILWERRYSGPTNSDDRPQALALDKNGDVVVTGVSYNQGNSGCYSAKYAASDGTLLWEQRYDGPDSSTDRPRAIAIDPSGNVAVIGFSCCTNGTEYYTAKYAAADGALLWERRYNNPGNTWGEPSAAATDRAGNVVIMGISNFDYYIAMYAAADGMLVWEKRHDGPSNGEKGAFALDSSGNVVVTGASFNGGSNYDYYTAKFAANDGALLWEKRYDGPSQDDYAIALAIDGKGNLAVTGSSAGDYATVVYWENLPPVSVQKVATGVRISFSGIPGRIYEIERASAVTGPWSTMSTATAPIQGTIEYTDNGPSTATTFYRTRSIEAPFR